MNLTRRTIWIGLIGSALAVAVVAGLVVASARRAPRPIEAALLFSGVNDDSWVDFTVAIRAAVDEVGAELEPTNDPKRIRVKTEKRTIDFVWYAEIGGRGMSLRTNELVGRAEPPIAIIGADNSQLTRVIATQLAAASTNRQPPILLMTFATADDLTSIYAGRSFRFGSNNSRQASTVVDALLEKTLRAKIDPKTVQWCVARAADDHFSIDLARRFADRLAERFSPTATRATSSAIRPIGDEIDPGRFWTLSTSTGSVERPSDEETRTARSMVDAIAKSPNRPWAIALPLAGETFRRSCSALQSAFDDHPDRSLVEMARRNVMILAGDTVSASTFTDPKDGRIGPREVFSPTLFFVHSAKGSGSPDSSSPPADGETAPRLSENRLIYLEVCRELLNYADRAEDPSPSADGLARFLERLSVDSGGEQMFARGERIRAGAARAAVLSADRSKIEIHPTAP